MKKSKKLVAFLMSAFMVCALPAVVTACDKDDEPPKHEQTDPVKVKDGTDISVKVNASAKITVSDYITANGTAVTATSSNPQVAEAKLENGVVTVTGKAKGVSTLKLTCGSVEVEFNVKVEAEEIKTPAPVFENLTASLDLHTASFAEVALAPKSGGDKFDMEYSLANPFDGAEITEGKLKFTPSKTGSYTIGISVKCTEKDDTENICNLNFSVIISVTDSEVEKQYFTVTIDGVETQVEEGQEFTLPEYTGDVPEGKLFDGWRIGEEKKNVGDKITVTENIIVTSVFKDKVYTVTIDGQEQSIVHGAELTLPEYTGDVPEGKLFDGWTVGGEKKNVGDKITVTENLVITSAFKNKVYTVTIDGQEQSVTHGEKITLPEYDGEVEEGKQFVGWTDGTNRYPAGNEVTVTCDIVFTAIIEEIPQTPPEIVKDSDEVRLVLDTSATVKLNISDYIVTNGHTVHISSSDDCVSANLGLEDITLTAVAFGSSTITLTCGNLTVTITVTVAYPPSEVIKDVVTDTTVYDLFAGGVSVDLSENITYNTQVVGYKVNGTAVEGNEYVVTGEFGETEEEVTLTVTAVLEDGELTYTYKLKVKDTTAYRIKNGNFDEWDGNKPVGWTVTEGYGSKQTASTYWAEERPFNNIGAYFGETNEDATGVLQSSEFIVGNSGWLTFQLGSANPATNIWVEVLSSDNTLLAKFKNTQWSDPENAQKLIPYKLNLGEIALGRSVYIRIVDEEGANTGRGFRTFFADSFESWYDEEPTTITADNGEVITFVNLGSPVFENAKAEIDLKDGATAEITLPEINFGVLTACAYTTDYEGAQIEGGKLKFTAAKSGTYVIPVTGTTVYGSTDFNVTVIVTNSKSRPEVSDANVGEINIDGDNLSLTYNLPESNDGFTCTYAIKTEVDGASVSGNTFTYEAVSSQTTGVVEVTLTVTFTDTQYPDDTYTEEITLSINIVGNTPTLKAEEIIKEIDLNGNESVDFSINLADNVNIPSSVTATYKVNGTEVVGNEYAATLNAGVHNLSVEVIYGDNAKLEYTVTVTVAQFTVKNGGFETGDLTGWTLSDWAATINPDEVPENVNIVQNTAGYWGGNAAYNHVGTYHFNGQDAGGIPEGATYTLTSSTFRLGGSGYISFKIGGHAAVIKVYDNATKEVIARYTNTAYQDAGFENGVPHVEKGARQAVMSTYIADLSDFIGLDLYIVLEDNLTGDWGHAIMDDVITYYETVPAVEGKFDVVKNLCKCGYNEDTDTYTTTNIPWVKAVSSVNLNRIHVTRNIETVVLGAGTVNLNDYLYADGILIGDTGASVSKQIIKVNDGNADITENFEAFTLESGKTYTVNYKLVSGEYFAETTIKIVVGDSHKVLNGDFENDLYGWTYKVAEGSTDFGRIVNDDYYWNNPDNTFNKANEGGKLFTGIETAPGTNQEGGKGTLSSSVFTLQQNGWISFRLGGAHNAECGIRVRSAADGSILAEFNNLDKGFDGKMDKYKYQFSGMQSDMMCYIEIFDNASTGWALVVVDDIETDCGATEPDGTIILSVI